jgi:hypothetical protein
LLNDAEHCFEGQLLEVFLKETGMRDSLSASVKGMQSILHLVIQQEKQLDLK